MRTTRVIPAGVATLAAVVIAGGCAQRPDTTSSQRNAAGAAQPAAPAQTTAPLSPAAREATDRAEIETTWANFQVLYPNLGTRYPTAEWPSRVADIAVDPIKSQVLRAAAQNLKAEVASYGLAVTHPSWQQPIAGKNTAVMRDCLDASRAGSMLMHTGHKRTVGVARASIRAYFVKGGDRKWRVRQIEYHVDEKC